MKVHGPHRCWLVLTLHNVLQAQRQHSPGCQLLALNFLWALVAYECTAKLHMQQQQQWHVGSNSSIAGGILRQLEGQMVSQEPQQQ